MKAVTIVEADDGSVSVFATDAETHEERIRLMHRAMEVESKTLLSPYPPKWKVG